MDRPEVTAVTCPIVNLVLTHQMRKVEIYVKTCGGKPVPRDPVLKTSSSCLQTEVHGLRVECTKAGYDVVKGYGTLESHLVEVNTSA